MTGDYYQCKSCHSTIRTRHSPGCPDTFAPYVIDVWRPARGGWAWKWVRTADSSIASSGYEYWRWVAVWTARRSANRDARDSKSRTTIPHWPRT